MLAIEEVQNLFKLAPVKERRRKDYNSEQATLTIKDDEVLKFFLSLINSWRLAFVVDGTFDGMAAFKTRFATAQRIASGGFFTVGRVHDTPIGYFRDALYPALSQCNYTDGPLPEWLPKMLVERSGGIQRILTNLWQFSQVRCLRRRSPNTSQLLLVEDDVRRAMEIDMAPLIPAIEALKSGGATADQRFEDLLPKDSLAWLGPIAASD